MTLYDGRIGNTHIYNIPSLFYLWKNKKYAKCKPIVSMNNYNSTGYGSKQN